MKKIISVVLSAAMALGLAACGSQAGAVSSQSSSSAAPQPSAQAVSTVQLAGLKGPTTMGMVNLNTLMENGTAAQQYDVSMLGTADEIVPQLVKGEVDIAAIPANLAAALYQKTEGGIQALAVNTLGVLYVVEQGDKDLQIEYCSEATEVTARMAEASDAIAVLPQPYVTAASLQNEALRVALDLTEEWGKVEDTQLITGVTVVRKAFAEQNPDAVADFLSDYAQSVQLAASDVQGTAALCEQYGVVAKAAIAQKALPACNIVCITGAEMKAAVSNYLQVLFEADPAAVGGNLPDDAFYYEAD